MKTHAAVAGKILLSYVFVFGFMIVIGIAYAIIALVSGKDINEFMDSVDSGMATHYIQIVLFIASAYMMYAIFERKKGWTIGLKQQSGMRLTLQGALSGIILISLAAGLIGLFGGVSWEIAQWDREMAAGLLSGLFLFIGVAVSEEIFSRGYVQGLLRYHYNAATAIIVSSILFALMHSLNPGMFDSPLPILNLLLAGIIMAVARELTGGLWWPIGLHLTWNYFQGYIYGFKVSGTDSLTSILTTTEHGPAWISGGAFGIEGSIFSVLMLILGTLGVYRLFRGKQLHSK